jgi:hypothetical protein
MKVVERLPKLDHQYRLEIRGLSIWSSKLDPPPVWMDIANKWRNCPPIVNHSGRVGRQREFGNLPCSHPDHNDTFEHAPKLPPPQDCLNVLPAKTARKYKVVRFYFNFYYNIISISIDLPFELVLQQNFDWPLHSWRMGKMVLISELHLRHNRPTVPSGLQGH